MRRSVKQLISHSQVKRWVFGRLRPSSGLDNNLPDIDYTTGKTLANRFRGRMTDPLASMSARTLSSRDVIDEIVMARYAKDEHDILSCLIIPRQGVFDHVLDAAHQINPKGYTIMHNHLRDWRSRIAVSVDRRCYANQDYCWELLQRMHAMVPADDDMIESYEQMIRLDAHSLQEAMTLPVDEAYSPPYHFDPNYAVLFSARTDANKQHFQDPAQRTTPLIDAILEDDSEGIHQLISANPRCVLEYTPWGEEAAEIALLLGKTEVYRAIISARARVVPESDNVQFFYQSLQYQNNIESYATKYKSEFVTELTQREEQPLPRRTPLQKACIEGDLQLVKHYTKQDPAQIEQTDLLGLKPLWLAAQSGHAHIVQWLIEEHRASVASYRYSRKYTGTFGYHLIDFVRSTDVLKVLLFNHADPDYLLHFVNAIRNNNVEIIKIFLHYLDKFSDDHLGLMPLEWAIRTASIEKISPKIIERILGYWNDYVPDGPYDKSLGSEIIQLLENHNRRISKRKEWIVKKPQWTSTNIAEHNLKMWFSFADKSKLNVTTKRVCDLTPNELSGCRVWFDQCFRLLKDDTPENRDAYFHKLFNSKRHQLAYVDLYRHKDEIIAFLAFEFLSTYHRSTGKALVFHAQLGACCKDYRNMGLVSLSFRGLLAASNINRDIPILCYAKCIEPGQGFNMFPLHYKGFPTHRVPKGLIPHVVKLTGEVLNMPEKTITAKLTVDSLNQGHTKSWKWDDFCKVDETVGTPILLFMEGNQQKFFDRVSPCGITEATLSETEAFWRREFELPSESNLTIARGTSA